MAHIRLDDPAFDAARLQAWLLQAGFSPAAPTAEGAARWVRYPGDPRVGLPGEAVEVRLSRGRGGHLQLLFCDAGGQPVEVESRALEATGPVTAFVDRYFRHLDAGVVARAARAWRQHLTDGRKMLVSLTGGMSAAEVGISLAEMIRGDAVHAISCTGANLEDDIFMLMGREGCRPVDRARPTERDPALMLPGFDRATGVRIPPSVKDALVDLLEPLWKAALDRDAGPRLGPDWLAEALRLLFIERPALRARRRDSWVCAALDAGVPIVVPGWAESTLGDAFAAWCRREDVPPHRLLSPDADATSALGRWYRRPENQGCGACLIGGGVAGDFAIRAAPPAAPWGYICRIGDAVGSDGDAALTEASTTPEGPRFAIQSDATLVAPLIFGYVLGR